jgi:Flp pilus assembly protein TadG
MSNSTGVDAKRSADTGILRHIQRFSTDQKGVAAFEFALIIPVLLSLYFMLNETASGMRASRKVTIVTRVMADLASRSTDLTNAAKDDILSAATPIMNPFPTTGGGIRLTSIRFDATGKGFVDWSEISGTGLAAYARCSVTEPTPGKTLVTVPAGLKVANTSLILAEANMKYKPVVGWNITGTLNLSEKLFMRPRVSDFVTRNGVVNAAC